jgi:hypothetical protein
MSLDTSTVYGTPAWWFRIHNNFGRLDPHPNGQKRRKKNEEMYCFDVLNFLF